MIALLNQVLAIKISIQLQIKSVSSIVPMPTTRTNSALKRAALIRKLRIVTKTY